MQCFKVYKIDANALCNVRICVYLYLYVQSIE